MNEQNAPVVIVGGGLAAATAVSSLRDEGYAGPIVVFAAEDHLPYERPPLSKGYLLGNDELDAVYPKDEQWYRDNDVEVRTGTRVTAIDPEAHTVTADGKEEAYSALVLATGSQPRAFGLADDAGGPVHYLRTIEDSQALRTLFTKGATIGFIGAGWIGLETAAAARNAGAEAIVWDTVPVPLARIVGEEVGELFAQLHREHGVDLRLNSTITGIRRDGDQLVVETADGSTSVDALVVGVGVTPDVALAEAAGIATDNGVLVDEHLRTSAADVYAVGDIANVDHPTLHRRVRVEHWDTAIKHGETVAKNIARGDAVADDLPYFFTDQYQLGMEYVGDPGPEGFDRVVITGDKEGPVGDRVFRAFWLRGDLVVAAMHVNDWDAIDRLRELVGTRVSDADLER
ncbi:FAD-dependent oxidoreductase [Calidifontibacter sp. DB0510]|uniref:FAD-dependent oxidoreductase n=1 Tax=Metallococcus carri TaxID=1656884 RepID=A0A967B086_9MICO|nr:FAD-dependent oxidoreductase [Metallococcus carri]NHN55040.1 FAD-dependent oxidoreductase [Metallococcus carri]NOP37386.1 FAD-dependent oxidoreductase [Calidifontibacter sp. DB2511S]